ncbi:hypothetical protein C0J52_00583 [Blattella germanica]|nr:hypothetical protein C0J52_00583 [Blattella germanica]
MMKWLVIMTLLLTDGIYGHLLAHPLISTKLLICSLNGHDEGVRHALKGLMEDSISMKRVQDCLLGCRASWLFLGDWMTTYVTGIDPIKLPIQIVDRIIPFRRYIEHFYEQAKDCVEEVVKKRKKCDMKKIIPKCLSWSFLPIWTATMDIAKLLTNKIFNKMSLEELLTLSFFNVKQGSSKYIQSTNRTMNITDIRSTTTVMSSLTPLNTVNFPSYLFNMFKQMYHLTSPSMNSVNFTNSTVKPS